MPDSPATHRPADERRAQLLDAAVDVLRERGLPGLTTRAVTTRAGVTHGIFHYVFGSKSALVRALVERELTGAVAVWGAAVATDDLETALRQAMHAQLDLVRADPDRHEVVTALIRAARDDAGASTAAWERRQYLDEIERRLASWSEQGRVTWDVPLPDVAALVLSATDGVIQTWTLDHDDARAESSLALLARGLSTLAHPT